MLRKEEITNPNSCLNRAADTEPVFVLRAHDELASLLVREWAALYETQKRKAGAWDDRAKKKHADALGLADAMQAWRTAQP